MLLWVPWMGFHYSMAMDRRLMSEMSLNMFVAMKDALRD